MKRTTSFMLIMALLISALLVLTLSSCSKTNDRLASQPAPVKHESYFSRVKYFKDGRKPATDTTWTLHLTADTLVAYYRTLDGYQYAETSTFSELGTFWTK